MLTEAQIKEIKDKKEEIKKKEKEERNARKTSRKVSIEDVAVVAAPPVSISSK
jgi:hypothetical protein